MGEITMLRTLAAGALAATLWTTSAVAQEEANADTVLATVNGTEITVGHVIALVSRLPDRFQSLPDKDLFDGVLSQLIQQTALSATVDRDVTGMRLAIENEVRALMATERLRAIETEAVAEDKVTAFYEENYLNAEPGKEWKASHILVKTEEEAVAIVSELEGGADFAELAKEKSTGPSGPNGGDLGWQGKGRLVPPFENAMIALQPEQVSAPVQTDFGWHVIKLMEVRDVATPPLVSVRAQILEQLRTTAVQAGIAEAESAAEIVRTEVEVDASVVRKTELLD
ncbi:MAG: peptidylprolyl isomerase [Pseudomonadota bacterium]